jgi:Putative adhesin
MPAFDTPGPITATLDIVAGDVRISASDRTTAAVDVRPSDPANDEDVKVAERTRVEYADGRLLVKTPRQHTWRPRNTGGFVEITVALPTGSHIQGTGGMTDFRSEGRLGHCRIKTGMGQIRIDSADELELKSGLGGLSVERATAHAELTLGSGDVRARALDAGAVIKNSNGDTWVGEAGGDLRIKAANGDIAVDVAHATVAAKSANGDVRLGEVVRDTVVLETRIGDLEVGIPEGTAAYLDVHAAAGHVHNALAAADAPERSAESVAIRARTSAGDIVIRRP